MHDVSRESISIIFNLAAGQAPRPILKANPDDRIQLRQENFTELPS